MPTLAPLSQIRLGPLCHSCAVAGTSGRKTSPEIDFIQCSTPNRPGSRRQKQVAGVARAGAGNLGAAGLVEASQALTSGLSSGSIPLLPTHRYRKTRWLAPETRGSATRLSPAPILQRGTGNPARWWVLPKVTMSAGARIQGLCFPGPQMEQVKASRASANHS